MKLYLINNLDDNKFELKEFIVGEDKWVEQTYKIIFTYQVPVGSEGYAEATPVAICGSSYKKDWQHEGLVSKYNIFQPDFRALNREELAEAGLQWSAGFIFIQVFKPKAWVKVFGYSKRSGMISEEIAKQLEIRCVEGLNLKFTIRPDLEYPSLSRYDAEGNFCKN